MRAIQSCMPPSAQAGFLGTFSSQGGNELGSIERVLIETRRRVLGVLDQGLDQIRATREAAAQMAGIKTETQMKQLQDESGVNLMEAAPLPQNVVTVSRELFVADTPREVVLDPALERATVEELNAALADAFNHVSGQ